MLWFLRDYPLAALLLRALTLACDELLIGGLFFCCVTVPLAILPDESGQLENRRCRLMRAAAAGLIAAQSCFLLLNSAVLLTTTSLRVSDLLTSNYVFAGGLLICAAAILLAFCRRVQIAPRSSLLLIAPLLFATVWTSHAASRIDDRLPLMVLTAVHQLSVAVWIGGMPYLWLLLRSNTEAQRPAGLQVAVRRYSVSAMAGAAALVFSGLILGWQYTGSWGGVYGTGYGLVLLIKTTLLLPVLLLGAANFLMIRNAQLAWPDLYAWLMRFSEVEIGIGFTIVLAAASLTAQPPAVDLVQDRVTLPEIVARFTPRLPSFATPSVSALPPVQPMAQAMRQYAAEPDDPMAANNRVERAWSEYNHHWAGAVVLAAGLLALLAQAGWSCWARHWPLAFLGLALFLFLRADPEAWPLGPRGFWASFYNPEDLQHRIFILLILSFVAFEWTVQTQRFRGNGSALVFPVVCALGGALLLAHEHSLGNVKEELLVEMSHAAIAVCAVLAGWSRWLEIRSPVRTRVRARAAFLWPVFLILIGLVLLNYREA